MRGDADAAKIRELMREIGRRARGPGRIYLTGGATAVLLGFRESTIDVDVKLEPEPDGVFEAIAMLKDELELNVELAAPDQFIPPLPGWSDRSLFIERHGPVDFFHYDLRAQALSKIERGHAQDVRDVEALLAGGHVDRAELRSAFAEIEPALVRYPALDPDAFRRKLDVALGGQGDG
jgi:hypothetical protein